MKNKTNEKNNITYTFNGYDKSDYIKFGKCIKEMRENRGLTQSDLSILTNRERSGLSAYERGINKPSIDALYEISNVLKYKLKINFEEDDKLKKDVPITYDFLDIFISNLYRDNTYENHIHNRVCDSEQTWNISNINDREAIITSEEGYKISFNVIENTNERYIPLNISIFKGKKLLIEDVAYRDLYNEFTLTVMEDIRALLYTCITTEEMIRSSYASGYIEDMIDSDKLMVFQYTCNMALKKEYKLTDPDIKLIIDEIISDKKNSIFVDSLTSSTENEKLLHTYYAQTLNTIESFIEDNILDTPIVNKIFQLSHGYRFRTALEEFLFEAGNDYDLARKILKGKFDENNSYSNEIDITLLMLIKFIYQHIDSKETNQSECDIIKIMKLVLNGFYPEVNQVLLHDTFADALYDIVDFEKLTKLF